jgi:hypothetical protein
MIAAAPWQPDGYRAGNFHRRYLKNLALSVDFMSNYSYIGACIPPAAYLEMSTWGSNDGQKSSAG